VCPTGKGRTGPPVAQARKSQLRGRGNPTDLAQKNRDSLTMQGRSILKKKRSTGPRGKEENSQLRRCLRKGSLASPGESGGKKTRKRGQKKASSKSPHTCEVLHKLWDTSRAPCPKKGEKRVYVHPRHGAKGGSLTQEEPAREKKNLGRTRSPSVAKWLC